MWARIVGKQTLLTFLCCANRRLLIETRVWPHKKCSDVWRSFLFPLRLNSLELSPAPHFMRRSGTESRCVLECTYCFLLTQDKLGVSLTQRFAGGNTHTLSCNLGEICTVSLSFAVYTVWKYRHCGSETLIHVLASALKGSSRVFCTGDSLFSQTNYFLAWKIHVYESKVKWHYN